MHGKLFKRMPKVATSPACMLSATAGIILLLAPPGAAQRDVSAEVDRHIKDEMQKQQIHGLSLAVIKAGQIILAKGYGFATVELLNDGKTYPYGLGWFLVSLRRRCIGRKSDVPPRRRKDTMSQSGGGN